MKRLLFTLRNCCTMTIYLGFCHFLPSIFSLLQPGWSYLQWQSGTQALLPSPPICLSPHLAFTVATNPPCSCLLLTSLSGVSISGSSNLKPVFCDTQQVTLPLWAVHQCSSCQDGNYKKRHKLRLRYAKE